MITGTTTLAPTVEQPTHDMLQFGAAARGSLDLGVLGVVADFLHATGDRSPNDGAQNGFHVDPNYPAGLLLFQQVMAAQTARGASTAAARGDTLAPSSIWGSAIGPWFTEPS